MTLDPKKLLTLNVRQLPILENALGHGVSFQPLFIDTANGIWCIRAFFGPGVTLPSHLHTGPVHAYTLSGKWYYAEHPDQPQTAGSYLYEPASSVPHLFKTPVENTEVTEIIFSVFGANVNFDEQPAASPAPRRYSLHSCPHACFHARLISVPFSHAPIILPKATMLCKIANFKKTFAELIWIQRSRLAGERMATLQTNYSINGERHDESTRR
jgi:2,4'-dihydroxyacetophenone dioxygenase